MYTIVLFLIIRTSIYTLHNYNTIEIFKVMYIELILREKSNLKFKYNIIIFFLSRQLNI